MKIALIGYGKMGKAIEQLALSSGHEIVLKVNKENSIELNKNNLINADVAIEFTEPDSVLRNINLCFDAGIPVVVGTTGWYEHLNEVKKLCEDKNGSMLYASNFSIGMNIFFEINKRLAQMMKSQNDYDVRIEEIHHSEKKDKPSGTAITIANTIIKEFGRKNEWTLEKQDNKNSKLLFINSVRKENVVGEHTINYNSEIDSIEIKHTAHSRKGFASGALQAAEWIQGRKGFFEMSDMMKNF